MILFTTIICCLFGTIVSGSDSHYSPVIVWGDDISPSAQPALHKVSESTFSDIVTPLLKDHMIVAFQEHDLSVDDFRCTSSDTKESCYAYLKDVPSKTYYANVENPIKTLSEISPSVEFNSVNSKGKLSEPINCSTEKVVFVSFSGDKTHSTDIESHDAAIETISKEIACPTVYMYLTSNSQKTFNRVRRDTAATNGGYIFRSGADLLLFFSNLYYVEGGVSKELIISSMTVTAVGTSKLSVSLTSSTSTPVNFDVIYSAGSYNMSNLEYNNMAFLSNNVYAPTTFSYSCGDLILPAKASLAENQLQWNSFQIQAPFGSTTNTSFVFSDSWDCVGFISPGVAMGFFVVALFLVITFTGICWMMDINTMDRFDDPKGKTITINAGE